jgi:hypothetical protein
MAVVTRARASQLRGMQAPVIRVVGTGATGIAPVTVSRTASR